MTFTHKSLLAGFITVLLFCTAALIASFASNVGASAPSGIPATLATSSNPSVTSAASLVFATSSCSARVITANTAIMITFGDTPFGGPTATYGHLQTASTTVVYDSGQVGCGAVRIYSYATQSISVSESR